MHKLSLVSVLLTCGLTLAGAPRAFALPEFPDDVQDATNAPCPPHCTLCHADEGPSEENLTQLFGEAFERRGGGETPARAIARMRADKLDSDGDGTGDIDELTLGSDPNNAYATSLCGPEVGCSVRLTPQGSPAWGSLSLFSIVGALSWLRRRRATRRAHHLR